MGHISIEDAITSRFENSTRSELLGYCDELGISDVRPDDEIRSIKNRLFTALGVADSIDSAGPAKSGRVFKSKVVPDVNLSPSGRWGGRRRRIRVPRPATATKSERAMPLAWNGKATYWLPYDEVTDVPWPIYMRLVEMKTPRVVRKTIDIGGGMNEITTDWKFDNIIFVDLGDDPVTADLPTSLTSWYQDKGPEFIKGLGERDLQLVASRLEVNIVGRDQKRLSQAEIVDSVLIFLFGVSAESMVEEA